MTTTDKRVEADVKDEVAALKASVEQLTADLGKLARHAARSAGAQASDGIDGLRHRVEAVAEEGVAQARRGVDAANRTVAEHPLPSVAIAFGLGLVASLLLLRR